VAHQITSERQLASQSNYENHDALPHAFESVDENQAKARFDHGERNRDLYEAAGAADATACSRIGSL